jgi:hypothetical protein
MPSYRVPFGRIPLVVSAFTYAVLSAHLSYRATRFHLLEDADDLLVRKVSTLHFSSPCSILWPENFYAETQYFIRSRSNEWLLTLGGEGTDDDESGAKASSQ